MEWLGRVSASACGTCDGCVAAGLPGRGVRPSRSCGGGPPFWPATLPQMCRAGGPHRGPVKCCPGGPTPCAWVCHADGPHPASWVCRAGGPLPTSWVCRAGGPHQWLSVSHGLACGRLVCPYVRGPVPCWSCWLKSCPGERRHPCVIPSRPRWTRPPPHVTRRHPQG